MKKPVIISLFNAKESNYLKKKFVNTLFEIKKDYFAEKDSDYFIKNTTFHESAIMKCLAYRLMDKKFFSIVKKKITKIFFKNKICSEKLFIHPIFYSRFGSSKNQTNIESFLDAQPHFDRSYDVKAFTVWTSLDKKDQGSGGLCFFKKNKFIIDNFYVNWGQKNRYNTNGYIKNAQRLDKNLKKTIIQKKLKKGEAFVFDSNILHGSTKSINRDRYSFDFRFIPESELKKIDGRYKRIILKFNENINLANLLNTKILGDYKFSKKKSKNQLKKIKSKFNLNDLAKISWRDEYAWIK